MEDNLWGSDSSSVFIQGTEIFNTFYQPFVGVWFLPGFSKIEMRFIFGSERAEKTCWELWKSYAVLVSGARNNPARIAENIVYHFGSWHAERGFVNRYSRVNYEDGLNYCVGGAIATL